MSPDVVMTSGRQVGFDQIMLGIGAAALALGTAAWLGPWRDRSLSPVPGNAAAPHDPDPHVKAARRLNRGAGILAVSVLLDSAVEHYRGSFHNRAMYTPLIVSAFVLATSAHGVTDPRPGSHALRDAVAIAAALTGAAGTGFHVYNVTKEPGGFSWQNLLYQAPMGAPSAIALSGLLSVMAERVRDAGGISPHFFDLPVGRTAAGIISVGLLGTVGEAGLLHFRGAYHNPFMYLPVSLPVLASALMAETVFGEPGRDRRFTRWILRLTAAMGFAGSFFHAYGVHRNMGGWRNWRQTILNGPPLPAPPSFTGLALAGLAAVMLRKEQPGA